MWTSSKHDTPTASALTAACTELKTMYEEENMEQEGDIDDIFFGDGSNMSFSNNDIDLIF